MYDFGDDYLSQLLKLSKNKFWIDAFSAWKNILIETLNDNCFSKEDIMLLPIWHNSQITIDKKNNLF